MPAKQLIAVTAAAYVTVSATIFSQYVEIQEDASGSAAGLEVTFPDDNFTQAYEYQPSAQPIKIGTPIVTGKSGSARLVGKPDRTVSVPSSVTGKYVNVDEPATIYCKVKSLGANTNIRVDERP
ncbi:MAG TPA: hypothetical protein VGG42_09870 [Acidobacteriaceae bacterium]|jgi:hypothetical protein